MSLLVLGCAEIVAAFALGGVPGRAVSGRLEALEALETAREEHGLRIVIVEEQVAETARQELEAMKLDHRAPLIVEIPGFAGPLETRRTPLEQVRQALGIRL